MAANWNLPTLTDTYTNFLTYLDARLDDAAKQFYSADGDPTNVPTNTVRWNSTNNQWQKYTGAAWADLVTSQTYNITATAASKLATARTLALSTDATGSVSFDGSANVTVGVTLSASGVTANNYGSASAVPVLGIDSKGRVTSASTAALGSMANQASSSVSITGGSISPGTFVIPFGTGSTTEGVAQWGTATSILTIGDGAATQSFSPNTGSATLTNKTLGSSCSFSVDLPISTGTVTTTSTTASLFNANATSIAIGAAANTFEVGLAGTSTFNINGTTDSTTTATGALVVDGGLGLAKALIVGTTAKVLSTTDSTSISTGSLILSGGLGIAKSVFIGGGLDASGSITGLSFLANLAGTQSSNLATIGCISGSSDIIGGASTTATSQLSLKSNVNPAAATITTHHHIVGIPNLNNTSSFTSLNGLLTRLDMGASALGGTITNYYGVGVPSPSINASATKTITNYYGVHTADYVKATGQGAPTLVVGHASEITSGTGRWNFYASGTASNYLLGNTLLGTSTDNGTDKLQVSGSATISSSLKVDTIVPISTTGNLMNTVATTLNIGGAATTLTLGTTGSNIFSLRGTGAVTLPVGTDAQRPTAATGMMRFNTTSTAFEGYNGTGWAAIGSGGGTTTQVYTTTGTNTWTKPTGLKRIKVTVVGGGGGGANDSGTASDFNGSGAGGGCAIKWIEAAALGTTETATVGTGGAGKTGATDGAGTAGGTTSFGAHCSATGGGGGAQCASSFVTPATPGTGSSGTINLSGEYGGITYYLSTDLATSTTFSGKGGDSILGIGGASKVAPSAGQNGQGYGSGGAAGVSTSTTDYNGGNGASGIIIVEEFY